jgi:hypothetical protein
MHIETLEGLARAQARADEADRLASQVLRAHPDLLNIAKLAANGTHVPRDWAKGILEKHGLKP